MTLTGRVSLLLLLGLVAVVLVRWAHRAGCWGLAVLLVSVVAVALARAGWGHRERLPVDPVRLGGSGASTLLLDQPRVPPACARWSGTPGSPSAGAREAEQPRGS